ncbi:PREDICTED: oleosin 1-like [Populus euphratica]|uniref:Oleosin 1-like n=1 Tax=Populus euphratica TaxID=75702 RepID=A0AAJ6U4E9_POPEU|nr:PREDICTED: oleosin 1-like [Populus euphratica]
MADLQKSKQRRRQPRSHQVVKATTAVTTGGSLLVVSSLTFTATVILLTVATPLLIIFSPVIVPAVITVYLLLMGFLVSGGFGVTGITVMTWMYRYVTGMHPPGAEQLDQAVMKLVGKAREMKERGELFGLQAAQ